MSIRVLAGAQPAAGDICSCQVASLGTVQVLQICHRVVSQHNMLECSTLLQGEPADSSGVCLLCVLLSFFQSPW